MSPLEQYMKTCQKKTGRFERSTVPCKAKLRADRQWLTVKQMATKYKIPVGAMADALMRYGIEDGMRYLYKGNVKKYQ